MDGQYELADYLGKNYQSHKMVWDRAREYEAAEKFDSWTEFQQRDKDSLYLYTRREVNDAHWLPQVAFAREVNAMAGGDALDYLSATGWVGLRYGAAAFADHKTKCSDFLRWRLKQRKSKASLYALDDDIPVYPLVVCFDAAHRYADAWELVEKLAGLGEVVAMDFDTRNVDAAELVDMIDQAYGLFLHRISDHYVHLVAFRTGAKVLEEE